MGAVAAEASVREIAASETALAFRAMHALRPHYRDEAAFVRRVDEVQRPEGYRLVGVFEPDADGDASAVAGFRLAHSLAWGRHVYVDDLSTHPDDRRRGHAGRLMTWLLEEARRLRCDSLHLDSGFGPERVDAHRLYFNSGLQIFSHHFARDLRETNG
jgi:GNAT superfamily N-acetyltransferase